MTVTLNEGFIDILPTGKADSPENYMQPAPQKQHTTFSFNDTHVFVHDLYWSNSESCAFADFVGDVGYTTPATIKAYLVTILNS